MGKIRLDKFLSEQKIATRSQIKVLLKKQNVCVNEVRVTDGSFKIEPFTDKISIDGRSISYEKNIYIMLNKPAGVVTATKDNINKTVLDLIGDDVTKKDKLSAVGRLDKDTTGLLILTDDGELNHRLVSPKHHVSKKYKAALDAPLDNFGDVCLEMKSGIDIGDDKKTLPAFLERTEEADTYFITITEGRYHQVKRMFQVFGRKVIALERISMGQLLLDKNLNYGEYRFLTKEETDSLKASD